MALNIRNSATEELATQVAELTGETKTEAVRRARVVPGNGPVGGGVALP